MDVNVVCEFMGAFSFLKNIKTCLFSPLKIFEVEFVGVLFVAY